MNHAAGGSLKLGGIGPGCRQEYESKVFSDFIIPRLGQSASGIIRLDCSPLESFLRLDSQILPELVCARQQETFFVLQFARSPAEIESCWISLEFRHGGHGRREATPRPLALERPESGASQQVFAIPVQSGLSRHNANEAVPSRQRFHAEVA